MGLRPNFDAMKVALPDFFRALEVDGDTTELTIRNRIVHVTQTTTGNITLPAVGDFVGETVAIYIASYAAGTLTIQDKDDSFNWTDIDLGSADESLVLYSDGIQWFVIGGTTVLIASVTASAAELNYLDITSLGTGAASKAVVLDGSGDYTWPNAGRLTYIGTEIAATGAEINLLDGSIAGTAVASAAAVLGANKELDTLVLADGGLYLGAGAGTSVTSTATELNYLDLAALGTGALEKAVVLDSGEDYTWPVAGILTYGVLKDPAGTALTATTLEINQMCDLSTFVEEITSSGAITPGVRHVELNHTGTAIAATIANSNAHPGIFTIKATTEPGGGQDHVVTLTSGTWNGTNNVATFADIDDELVVHFDSNGKGIVILNNGSVVLS